MNDYFQSLTDFRTARITDERPKPEVPAFMDDPRPTLVLENVTGLSRRKSHWHHSVLEPVTELSDRLLLAARSVF